MTCHAKRSQNLADITEGNDGVDVCRKLSVWRDMIKEVMRMIRQILASPPSSFVLPSPEIWDQLMSRLSRSVEINRRSGETRAVSFMLKSDIIKKKVWLRTAYRPS